MEQKFVVTKSQLKRLVKKSRKVMKSAGVDKFFDNLNEDRLVVFDKQLEKLEQQYTQAKKNILDKKASGESNCKINMGFFPHSAKGIDISLSVDYNYDISRKMSDEFRKMFFAEIGKVGKITDNGVVIPKDKLTGDWGKIDNEFNVYALAKNNSELATISKRVATAIQGFKKFLVK